jgi:hypothetical protein
MIAETIHDGSPTDNQGQDSLSFITTFSCGLEKGTIPGRLPATIAGGGRAPPLSMPGMWNVTMTVDRMNGGARS